MPESDDSRCRVNRTRVARTIVDLRLVCECVGWRGEPSVCRAVADSTSAIRPIRTPAPRVTHTHQSVGYCNGSTFGCEKRKATGRDVLCLPAGGIGCRSGRERKRKATNGQGRVRA